MYRQGDILFVPAKLPSKTRPHGEVVAEGEVTGHAHRVKNAQVLASVAPRAPGSQEALFVVVDSDHAKVVHEEHAPIKLPRGTYEVVQQREYDGELGWTPVLD